ncbi:hypothetical protein EPK99_13255 [Neorhizobium lilium]|uniref:Porin n=1 Tax=Neorhizobium lilium TaxID=2503024 RepID=A0A3S3SC82_9HYPH|nr:hypothetical protein [Neorhizobium lilium]RWX76647.1 hypothetical protein EPK99_13255 [Neorhizobium lilium]
MKKFKIGLTAAAVVALAVSSASASIPRIAAPLGAEHVAKSSMVQTASFAQGCKDPNYAWYEYSGWEAIGCLVSGQWP